MIKISNASFTSLGACLVFYLHKIGMFHFFFIFFIFFLLHSRFLGVSYWRIPWPACPNQPW